MDHKQKISRFIQNGQSHLNAGMQQRAGVWALLLFGAAALPLELVFIVRGYRVPLIVMLLPLAAALIAAVICYLRTRFLHSRAVGHLDRFFGLKEGLVTADEHIREGRSEEIHDLQLSHTDRRLEAHDPAAVRPRLSRRLLGTAVFLICLSSGLLFVDDSLAVKEARAEEEAVLELAEVIADEIKEEFEKVLEEVDKDAAELLEDPELKEMLESFQAQGDRMAMMRKLSEIDSRMAKMQSGLDTRADENYLQELGEQLKTAKETSELGKALGQKNYAKAAGELEKMKLGQKNSARQMTALEKLAARVGETEKSMSSSQSGSRRDAKEMSREISKMMQEQKKSGQCSQGCKDCVNKSISKNSSSMKQVSARKQANKGLEQLRQKLQGSQSCMRSGNKPGNGKMAGQGVDRSRRQPQPTDPATGQLEHLSGQLGEGESRKEIQAADSGGGTASEVMGDKAPVDYRQSVEAFVRREDIPDEMKQGVKNYFEQIHTLEKELNEGAE